MREDAGIQHGDPHPGTPLRMIHVHPEPAQQAVVKSDQPCLWRPTLGPGSRHGGHGVVGENILPIEQVGEVRPFIVGEAHGAQWIELVHEMDPAAGEGEEEFPVGFLRREAEDDFVRRAAGEHFHGAAILEFIPRDRPRAHRHRQRGISRDQLHRLQDRGGGRHRRRARKPPPGEAAAADQRECY